jgi:hypothetical protein
LIPKLNFFLPAVMGRSAKIGPKVSVLRLKTPRASSKVYVKPADEEPRGKVESWVAMPRLSSVSVACA